MPPIPFASPNPPDLGQPLHSIPLGEDTAYLYAGNLMRFIGNADVDGDGTNGKIGGVACYRTDNTGLDYLANARDGQVWVGVIEYKGSPLAGINKYDPKGFVSPTKYRFPGFSEEDPDAYPDGLEFPWIVVPPQLVRAVQPAVFGCQAWVRNIHSGIWHPSAVVDEGPWSKDGEISPKLAQLLGIPSSPKNGGTDDKIIEYVIQAGTLAVLPDMNGNAVRFPLMFANGNYVR